MCEKERVCVCISVCDYVSVNVCVCVSVREIWRERERERGIETGFSPPTHEDACPPAASERKENNLT